MIDKDVLNSITEPKFRQVCDKVITIMNRAAVPGAAVGILYEGQEYIAGFGVTSVEHPLPVTEDTLFQIGSITKTFVATAAMRLVEMGKLELDTPIRAYLPNLRLADEGTAAQVTMRHLLTHTGGWVGDYFNDFGLGGDALATMVTKVADLPQLAPLGAIWSYNNSAFYLAGRVIEVVTGMNFEAALKELILDPLGMTMSFFFAHEVITHRFVVGHQVVDNQPQVARPWVIGRAAHAAGGLICPIKDLFRYARFHMGDGTTPDGARLLTSASLNSMQTPLFPAGGIDLMGLSWFITPMTGHTMIGHGGGTNGQITNFRLVPARKFALAVFTNSGEGGMLCREVIDFALKEYLDITLPQATPLDVPEAQLAAYTGRYEAAMTIYDINWHEGGLVLQVTDKGGFPLPDSPSRPSPPPVRIAVYAEDKIVALDDPLKDMRGEFLRNPDGSIAWFRFGGRVHARK